MKQIVMKKHLLAVTFLVSALMLFSANVASAQEQKGKGQEKGHQNQNISQQQKEEIEAMKIAFFTKQLALTPEESMRFWPLYNTCDMEMAKARIETGKSRKALLHACNAENPNSAEIQSLAETFYHNMEMENTLTKRHFEEYKKILPIEKAAKVRIVEEKFFKNLVNQLKRNKPAAGQEPPKKPKN